MGQYYISSGQVSSGLNVNSGGSLYVLNGGEAYDTTINPFGRMYISSGGSGSGALVNPAAYVSVASSGRMQAIKENGGVVRWSSGAAVSFVPNVFSGYKYGYSYQASNATIHSGTTAVSTTLFLYGNLEVYRDGLASATTISSGGSMDIYAGGNATYTTINNGARMSVYQEGSASNVVVSAGAYLYTAMDGSSYAIKENGGVVEWAAGAEVSFVPSVISKYTYGYGYNASRATIHSGTTAVSTTLLLYGDLDVYRGGLASETLVKSGGDLNVYAGAKAFNTVVENGAGMSVYQEGSASNVTVSQGGYLSAAYDGTVHEIKEEGGIVKWADGAEVSFVPSVFSKYSYGYGYQASGATLHSGTTAASTTLYLYGNIHAYNGALVLDTRINSGGELYVYYGAKAYDNDLKLGGGMSVFNGGVASNVVVSSAAYLLISSGGTAVGIKESGGIVEWYDGATVSFLPSEFSNFTYGYGAKASTCVIHSGTTANSTTLNLYGKLTVRKGALATGTRINSGGTMAVTNGGTARETTLKLKGVAVASSGGAIASVNVSSGGSVYVSSGGKLTGQITINAGAVVSALSNSILDFDLTGTSAGGTALLNNLSLVKGAPTFTLTVDGTLTSGTYNLAEGASGFSKTVSVMNAGTKLGTLTVGQTAKIGGVDYTLNLNDSLLSVTVSGATPAPTSKPAKFDVDGNDVSDVMFVWTGYNYAHGYWMNGDANDWRSTYAVHPAEWENLGCYDMNGDGKADSVLVGNITLEAGKGAYIGYYLNGEDTDANWVNIDFLNNEAGVTWKNKVCNLTGNANANSIIWYAPDMYTLGAWLDGTSEWALLNGSFGGEFWQMVGCGDFDGDGKDSVLMSGGNGQMLYSVGLDGVATSHGSLNWSGWDVRAVGDFAGDGKDDIVLFHSTLGAMALLVDGNADNYVSLGQLDPNDWFVVGAGDYNNDQKDDLLVRQKSTGMLGYYNACDTSETGWVEMGRGVDLNWTVIA